MLEKAQVEPGVKALRRAGGDRMSEALDAWSNGQYQRAAAAAPMACEFLAKATLWQQNPTLIVSLESRQDKALIALATAPHLAIPGLRTVTLRSALDRVALMHGPLPITSERQQQLIDCRNSSTHVGMIPRSDGESEERFARRVLSDSLLLSNFFLDHLDHDTSQFYGQHKSMVAGLLDKQRTETQQQVDRLLANAKTRIDSLREHFDDDELWRSSAQELEAVDPPRLAILLDSDQLPIEYDCPSCGYRGRLIGAIEVDVTMDFDVSDGESMPAPFFTTFFHARSFLCNVCKLELRGAELEVAGIPTASRQIEDHELGDNFDPAEWEAGRYGDDDY
ncbi:hypothetical protein [Rhodococcoides kroppenstedtii]|nr:hypothetical protein [Rhodococcus kroppenstedtii]